MQITNQANHVIMKSCLINQISSEATQIIMQYLNHANQQTWTTCNHTRSKLQRSKKQSKHTTMQSCNPKKHAISIQLKNKNVSTRYTYFSHFLKIRLCKMNFLVRLFQKPFTKQIKQMLIIIQFMSFLFF